MLSLRHLLTASLPIILISACAQADGIGEDGTVYDGVSDQAVITASGTEPFWTIEITPKAARAYDALYKTPENIEGQGFEVVRFAGNNGLGFSGTVEQKAVQIAITPGDCSDGMSDRTYPFAVTAGIGDETLRGCAYTSENRFSGPENP